MALYFRQIHDVQYGVAKTKSFCDKMYRKTAKIALIFEQYNGWTIFMFHLQKLQISSVLLMNEWCTE